MENVKRINKFLTENYGLSLDNKPKFRVAWSEDLYETRKGIFGPIAIYETIQQAPKYMTITDRWVLEVYTLAFPGIFGRSIEHKREVVMESDDYEFLRVFQTKNGEYLKPDLEICKIICDRFSELITRPEARRLTAKQANYDDVKKMREETEKFYELLSANDSDMLAGRFVDKEAVIIHREEA